jgi:dCMP deaminase
MNIARAASLRSEDPYLKVGACVLAEDHAVESVGYNGAPSGVDIDWSDRDARRSLVIHAEQNALRHTTPWAARGGLLAVTHHPCAECVRLTASYDIEVIYWQGDLDWSRYDRDHIEHVAAQLDVRLIRI